jgi:hypothetical protein
MHCDREIENPEAYTAAIRACTECPVSREAVRRCRDCGRPVAWAEFRDGRRQLCAVMERGDGQYAALKTCPHSHCDAPIPGWYDALPTLPERLQADRYYIACRARKPHHCDACQGKIEPGEGYVVSRVNEGSPFGRPCFRALRALCLDCADVEL